MFFVGSWMALYGLWLLYVDTLAPSELIAGIPAAALAALALGVLRRRALIPLRPRARWFARSWRLPGKVVADFGLVMWALVRRLSGQDVRGRFRAFPFSARGDDDESVARRVLATAVASLAPNAYVVGFDRRLNRMLVHELVRKTRPEGTLDAVEVD